MLGVTARRLEHLLRRAPDFHVRTPWSYYAIALVALLLVLPGAGLKTTAAPPEQNEPGASKAATKEPLSLPGRGEGEGGRAASPPGQALNDVTAKEKQALARLGELGATVQDGQDNKGNRQVLVGFDRNWKGRESDLRRMAEIPATVSVYWEFHDLGPETLAALNTEKPIDTLTLGNATDDVLANLARLPTCQNLILSDAHLSNAGAMPCGARHGRRATPSQ